MTTGEPSSPADDSVRIYRVAEAPPSPGWRSLADSVETATVSYDVPREAWEAYRTAEAEFERQASLIGSHVEAAPPHHDIQLT